MIDPNRHLQYKGYLGSVEYSAEDGYLYGSVQGIRGLIMYHSDTLEGFVADFRDAIDHYLSACEEEGIEPNKPEYEFITP
jgi:predicted HicB family RNase H-like nuclease